MAVTVAATGLEVKGTAEWGAGPGGLARRVAAPL